MYTGRQTSQPDILPFVIGYLYIHMYVHMYRYVHFKHESIGQCL